MVRCSACLDAGPCLACELVAVKAEREGLRQDNELLRKQVAQLSEGIHLRGWWCLTCSIFNGAEHTERTHCRRCGIPKGAS